MKKLLRFAVLSPLLFYPTLAITAPYCDGHADHQPMMGQMQNHQYMMNHMNNADAKSMQEFMDKRAELNKLYDQGVKENDQRAQKLIQQLDALSNKMQTDTAQPYRYRSAVNHYGQHGCR